ncbi:MAG: tyrosine-type recombinase/integrase, partial [Acidobacteria bacterium]|nr:tyrosine-type recombinase/integrase [Acidobacteriota bacterium]
IEGLRLHDLRHSFVSRLVAAGVPAPIAMKLSGHKTMAMLNRYLNPDKDFRRRAVEALAVFCRKAGDESAE